MILRLSILCLATAYITDALYLKYKAPNSKALQDIKGNLGKNRYPRHVHDITQWLRNNQRQQLVVLHRKDKGVDEFIEKLISLIEESHPTLSGKPKHCIENFGSSHDEHNEICERHNSNSKNELSLIIPIPIKRKEQEKETDLDFRRIFDTRRYSSSESSVENRKSGSMGKRAKRFEIIGNKKKSYRENKKVYNYNDYSDDAKDRSEEDRDSSDSEELSTEKPIKKKKSIKKKPISAESDNDRYSYIQGSRIMNANRRQNRMNYFLPKRYHWKDDELQHLGYYWFEGNS